LCNNSSQCNANPCWFGATCVDIANLDYICICPPNYTGKDCRTLVSCQSNSCYNGGTCIQTGIFEERIFVDIYFFLLAYGARCNCPVDIHGDYCQYTTAIKPIPNIESRQIDAETLAAIASLGSSNTNSQRAITFALGMGNHGQFVFCLTNPCENGGTCFVTNTATTKVKMLNKDWYIRLIIFFLGTLYLSRRIYG
jgi:hypothetical protein